MGYIYLRFDENKLTEDNLKKLYEEANKLGLDLEVSDIGNLKDMFLLEQAKERIELAEDSEDATFCNRIRAKITKEVERLFDENDDSLINTDRMSYLTYLGITKIIPDFYDNSKHKVIVTNEDELKAIPANIQTSDWRTILEGTKEECIEYCENNDYMY